MGNYSPKFRDQAAATPFEEVLKNSSKDHTVAASTFPMTTLAIALHYSGLNCTNNQGSNGKLGAFIIINVCA